MWMEDGCKWAQGPFGSNGNVLKLGRGDGDTTV